MAAVNVSIITIKFSEQSSFTQPTTEQETYRTETEIDTIEQ